MCERGTEILGTYTLIFTKNKLRKCSIDTLEANSPERINQADKSVNIPANDL